MEVTVRYDPLISGHSTDKDRTDSNNRLQFIELIEEPGLLRYRFDVKSADAFAQNTSFMTLTLDTIKKLKDTVQIDVALTTVAGETRTLPTYRLAFDIKVDKTALAALVTLVSEFVDSVTVGTADGEYPPYAHDAVTEAIDSARAVCESDASTDDAVVQSYQQLEEAYQRFKDSVVTRTFAHYAQDFAQDSTVPATAGTEYQANAVDGVLQVNLKQSESRVRFADAKLGYGDYYFTFATSSVADQLRFHLFDATGASKLEVLCENGNSWVWALGGNWGYLAGGTPLAANQKHIRR